MAVGKTYNLAYIRDYLNYNKKKILYINIWAEDQHKTQDLMDFGTSKEFFKRVNSSEGQKVYDILVDNYVPEVGKLIKNSIKEKVKECFILLDGCDSGLSIDLLMQLRNFFKLVLDDTKDSSLDVYIIVSANNYELVYGYNCIWLPTLEKYRLGEQADGYNLWRHRYVEEYNKVNKS